MPQHILKRWEAIELFTKMVSKYEKVGPSNSEQDELIIKKDLSAKLNFYKKPKNSTEFAEKALKPIIEEYAKDQKLHLAMSSFCSDILKGRPIRPSENQLEFFCRYTDTKKTRYQKETDTDSKASIFENTKWYLYFRTHYKSSISGKEELIICQVVITFFEFGYMEIYYALIENGIIGVPTKYQGEYYTKNQEFLFVEGRIMNNRELRIIFQLDKKRYFFQEADICVGYYLNASDNINFGPVLIERISMDTTASIRLFKNEDRITEQSKINDLYWFFFEKEFLYEMPIISNRENLKGLFSQ